MAAGGWLGWAAGMLVSVWLAFILSAVGTGIGLYVGRRIDDEFF